MIDKRKFYFASWTEALEKKFSANRQNNAYFTDLQNSKATASGEPDVPWSAMVFIATEDGLVCWTHGDFLSGGGGGSNAYWDD